MSIQEIKEQLVVMPRKEQDELVAFLFKLRHEDDDYTAAISRRAMDSDPSHWLSPDDFERILEQKKPQ